jgi:hypothetical protein
VDSDVLEFNLSHSPNRAGSTRSMIPQSIEGLLFGFERPSSRSGGRIFELSLLVFDNFDSCFGFCLVFGPARTRRSSSARCRRVWPPQPTGLPRASVTVGL